MAPTDECKTAEIWDCGCPFEGPHGPECAFSTPDEKAASMSTPPLPRPPEERKPPWKAAAVSDPRERLELRLREMLDDDDAVSVVQIILAEGWTPPPEEDVTDA